MAEPGLPTEWDQLSIETPELVAIDMPVAGIGSRFVAILVDYLIWTVAIIAAIIVIAVVDPSLHGFSKLGEKWATAIAIALPFLVFWGYFTLFEAFWDGRTPGKRLARIRVIQRSGRGIGLFESMTRNLLRIVDQFPLVYAVGVVSIFLTRDHQRLGDLAAGTLVIHDRQNLTEQNSSSGGRTFTAGMFEKAPALEWSAARSNATLLHGHGALVGLEARDLEVLEGFFARRLDFSLETRALLAQKIANGVRAKTGLTVPDGMSTETFLEEIARQLRDVARLG
jgi:uncharacterized RDD family membrane protein YckC